MSYLNDIEKRLDLPAATKQQVLRELASHFADLKSELIESGMEASQAEIEAEKRLGEPADVAARLNAAHNSASWKSALLCAVPFVASAVLIIMSSTRLWAILAAVLSVVFAAGSIWALAKGIRPVWSALWLAGALRFSAATVSHFPATLGAGASSFQRGALALIAAALIASAVVAAWRAHRWLRAVTLYSAVLSAATVYIVVSNTTHFLNSTERFALLVSTLCALALVSYLGRCVFELHPYGNAVQASLLVAGWITLATLGQGANVFLGGLVAGELLCAVTVAWTVRAPLLRDKCRALWAMLFIWAFTRDMHVFILQTTLVQGLLHVVSTALIAFVAYFVVTIPMRGERRQSPDRPSIVR